MSKKGNKMANEKDVSLEFVYHMLNEIRDEQRRLSDELISHAKDDAKNSKVIADQLTDIKIHLATLEQKVKHHTGHFNKVWAIALPIIISLSTMALANKLHF